MVEATQRLNTTLAKICLSQEHFSFLAGHFKLSHGNGKAWAAWPGGEVVRGHGCRDRGGEDQRAGGRIQLDWSVLTPHFRFKQAGGHLIAVTWRPCNLGWTGELNSNNLQLYTNQQHASVLKYIVNQDGSRLVAHGAVPPPCRGGVHQGEAAHLPL